MVFYAQSTSAVISGRLPVVEKRIYTLETDGQTDERTDTQTDARLPNADSKRRTAAAFMVVLAHRLGPNTTIKELIN